MVDVLLLPSCTARKLVSMFRGDVVETKLVTKRAAVKECVHGCVSKAAGVGQCVT